jgi:transcriptional regulator with XRE-family HTH domain
MIRIDGSKIRQARLRAGMTQAQLARSIRTTERNVVRWENSQNQPRVSSLHAIAEATGHTVDYFLSAAGDEDDEESDPAAMTIDDYLRLRIRQIVHEETRRVEENLA